MARVLSVFDVVHVHPNNCCGIHDVNGVPLPGVVELTLIRKDRGGRRTPVRSLPHPCDAPNLPMKKDIRLPSGWLER